MKMRCLTKNTNEDVRFEGKGENSRKKCNEKTHKNKIRHLTPKEKISKKSMRIFG
jgi:hypothetical protein